MSCFSKPVHVFLMADLWLQRCMMPDKSYSGSVMPAVVGCDWKVISKQLEGFSAQQLVWPHQFQTLVCMCVCEREGMSEPCVNTRCHEGFLQISWAQTVSLKAEHATDITHRHTPRLTTSLKKEAAVHHLSDVRAQPLDKLCEQWEIRAIYHLCRATEKGIRVVVKIFWGSKENKTWCKSLVVLDIYVKILSPYFLLVGVKNHFYAM